MASEPDGKKAAESDDPLGIKSWSLKTAAAIIGSLGLAGAMVVIGSGVLWVRFKEAGIPAIQAVSAQSRDEALTQGAQTTLLFVLIALAAVAFLYVVDGRDLKAAAGEGEKPKKPEDEHSIKWRTSVCVALAAAGGVAWAITTSLSFWWVVALGGLAALLLIGCLAVGRDDSKNFWALAGALFVSVIVFSAVSGYLIVKDQKFIQAVAVLRGGEHSDLTGFYVGADGEDLYVAVPAGPGAGRSGDRAIQKIKLGETDSYLVGPLEKISEAERTATALLATLRTQSVGDASDAAVSLPSWVAGGIVDTFTADPRPQTEVTGEPLCMMRFADAEKAAKPGAFWTSCAEAESLATINDARQRLALPIRFQKAYTTRVKIEVPVGRKLDYVEGGIAPQCGGGEGEPCGNSYTGGGFQYWIAKPAQLDPAEFTCARTGSNADQAAAWEPVACE